MTQWPAGTQQNTRSHKYGYDALNRLIRADVGILSADGQAIETTPVTGSESLPRFADWYLDNLGNWTGGDGQASAGAGLEVAADLDGDGRTDALTLDHARDQFNRVTGRELAVEWGDPNEPDSAGGDARVYDRAGNLVLIITLDPATQQPAPNRSFFFQYDAWNRLMQVNLAGQIDPNEIDPNTGLPIDPDEPGQQPGDLLKRFLYDGLGRLVAQRTPVVPGGGHGSCATAL